MRPQITTPKSFKRALNYNEKKVQKGTAELLHAQNFLKLPKEMNFHDKLERFEDLMALNERATTKTIHISLNFHPSENDRLSKDLLVQLADEYMEKVGFGNQPYLVYQHHDAGHPHVHILSTLIKEDGSRIPSHNMAKNMSEPVRKEMELQYGLIPANKKEVQQELEKQLVVSPQKVQAGKSETMRSITNVLDHVIDQYKYTSLQELNAVLRQYNVKADRGAEEGRIYQNRGLRYVVIDQEGKALTKPVKASALHNKPTLDYIESKFKDNELKREPHKKRVRVAVDWAMQSRPETLGELSKLLQKDRIALVIRRNEEGRVYGMTYIDHEKKTVFNGSDLGKEYSAKRMLERMGTVRELEKQFLQINDRLVTQSKQAKAAEKENNITEEIGKGLSKMIEQVIELDYGSTGINKELTEEEKRKRRRQQQQEL